MTVTGYNVQPDVNDHQPTIKVEHEEGLTTATVYIGQQYYTEEIEMTVQEMRVLRGQLLAAINKINWQEATWVYARVAGKQITHLMRKGKHGKYAPTVCGCKNPYPFSWSLDPVEGDHNAMNMCKKCQAIYDKAAQQA